MRGALALASLVAASSLSGCTRAACYAPETCASICRGAAPSGFHPLEEACQCVVSCDLGVCNAVPYCSP